MFCIRKTPGRDCSEITFLNAFAGFHLLEILIALTIIGLLAINTLPSYFDFMVKAKRLEAAEGLSRLALALEQYYVEHQTYEGATFDVLHVPKTIANQAYQLAIQLPTAYDYRLSAAPQGRQAQEDKLCGTLKLSAAGEKSNSGAGELEDCW